MSVYLTLRTAEKKSTAEKIIDELIYVFGKDTVDVSKDYGDWQPIRINDTSGWVGINDISFNGESRIHIFRQNTELTYDIKLNDIDTIYNM